MKVQIDFEHPFVLKAFSIAAEKSDIEIIQMFINKRVELNSLIHKDKSPLMLALDRSPEIFSLLLDHPFTKINLKHKTNSKTVLY